MLLVYPGELYRLLGASSLFNSLIHLRTPSVVIYRFVCRLTYIGTSFPCLFLGGKYFKSMLFWHIRQQWVKVNRSKPLRHFLDFKSHDFVYEKMEKPYDTWVWDCNSLFRSYTAGGYNSTGLSVSLVLNHHSFVRDWKPVVWITRLHPFTDTFCSNIQVCLPVDLHRYFHFHVYF
jgi:hypothetical protein